MEDNKLCSQLYLGQNNFYSTNYMLREWMEIFTVADIINDIGIFRSTLCITGKIVNLIKSWSTFKAIIIIWSKASFTSWMTTHTNIVFHIIEKTNCITIGNTLIVIRLRLNKKHSWGALFATVFRRTIAGVTWKMTI